MVPAHKMGEFFGLFGVLERFANVLGPAAFSLAIAWTGNLRAGMLPLIRFFAVGLDPVARGRVEAGRKLARAVGKLMPRNARGRSRWEPASLTFRARRALSALLLSAGRTELRRCRESRAAAETELRARGLLHPRRAGAGRAATTPAPKESGALLLALLVVICCASPSPTPSPAPPSRPALPPPPSPPPPLAMPSPAPSILAGRELAERADTAHRAR